MRLQIMHLLRLSRMDFSVGSVRYCIRRNKRCWNKLVSGIALVAGMGSKNGQDKLVEGGTVARVAGRRRNRYTFQDADWPSGCNHIDGSYWHSILFCSSRILRSLTPNNYIEYKSGSPTGCLPWIYHTITHSPLRPTSTSLKNSCRPNNPLIGLDGVTFLRMLRLLRICFSGVSILAAGVLL